MVDDADARRQRAERLHKQIASVTGKKPAEKQHPRISDASGPDLPKDTSDKTKPVSPPSPREFIERRMRELEEAEKRDNGADDDS
ncbi:hypothetical protein [Caballeronia sp. KNU42]